MILYKICQKVLNMITDLIIRKNNVLTDGNIPDRKVLTEKVANVLYHYYEEKGVEFKISIPELLRALNLGEKGDNQQRLKEAIQILQSPIQIRNFDYKGKSISWFSAPFLSRAYIEKNYANIIDFKIDDMLIEALKQQSTFTQIDIETTNKFKTKYGITLYHMYLRYRGMKVQGSTEATYIHKTLAELNKKFYTNYKTQSEMMRSLRRGLKEIKSITDVSIFISWKKELKVFEFLWERIENKNETNDFKSFVKWVRTNFAGQGLMQFRYKNSFQEGDAVIAVDKNGHIIDLNETWSFNKKEAEEIWKRLFNNQKTILAFKEKISEI